MIKVKVKFSLVVASFMATMSGALGADSSDQPQPNSSSASARQDGAQPRKHFKLFRSVGKALKHTSHFVGFAIPPNNDVDVTLRGPMPKEIQKVEAPSDIAPAKTNADPAKD